MAGSPRDCCLGFAAASHFAVNILAADQINLSNQFARPSDDKFVGTKAEEDAGGAPLFSGCAARFQCELHQQVEAVTTGF